MWSGIIRERKAGFCLTSYGIEILPMAEKLCLEFDKLQMKIDDMNGIGQNELKTFNLICRSEDVSYW